MNDPSYIKLRIAAIIRNFLATELELSEAISVEVQPVTDLQTQIRVKLVKDRPALYYIVQVKEQR